MMRHLAVTILAVALAGAALPAQDGAYPPGVTKEIQEAIERGLDWLARNQGNDGCWRNSGGYGSYPAAMTGLAGMALIAGGSHADARQVLRAGAPTR
jgi:hypothetical protein